MRLALLALLGHPLHGPPVGALHAQALPRAAGIPAPAALGLLQALGARSQAGAVLGWKVGGKRGRLTTCAVLAVVTKN